MNGQRVGFQPPGRPAKDLRVQVRGWDAGLVQQGMPDGGSCFALLPELRPVAGNGCIQLDLAFIQQVPDGCRCESF